MKAASPEGPKRLRGTLCKITYAALSVKPKPGAQHRPAPAPVGHPRAASPHLRKPDLPQRSASSHLPSRHEASPCRKKRLQERTDVIP